MLKCVRKLHLLVAIDETPESVTPHRSASIRCNMGRPSEKDWIPSSPIWLESLFITVTLPMSSYVRLGSPEASTAASLEVSPQYPKDCIFPTQPKSLKLCEVVDHLFHGIFAIALHSQLVFAEVEVGEGQTITGYRRHSLCCDACFLCGSPYGYLKLTFAASAFLPVSLSIYLQYRRSNLCTVPAAFGGHEIPLQSAPIRWIRKDSTAVRKSWHPAMPSRSQ